MTDRYAAVLFDVGQTLLRVEPSVGDVYAAEAARYGVRIDPADINRVFYDHWRRGRASFPDNLGRSASEAQERAWWHAAVEAVFRALGRYDDFGGRFEDYFSDLFERFAYPDVWHVYEDVRPTFDALDRLGLRIGAVSNWDHRLSVLLERLGLAARFEFVVISSQAGWRKPDPRIFREALRRLDLPADRVAYVGDSYEDDVVGARSVGMGAVLVDRHAEQSNAERLATLADLPRWLKGDP